MDAAYPLVIDESNQTPELPDELPPPSGEDIRPDSFAVTTGFLRSGTAPLDIPRSPPGPPLSYEEADMEAHRFFASLAGDRDVTHYDDPVEHVRFNGLMILYSAEAADAFETFLVRMPEPRVAVWRELITGGASSEAFGPLTLAERLDEKQVEEALVAGRKQRIINLSVALVVLVAIGGGLALGWQVLNQDEARTQGTLRFETSDEPPEVAAVEGGPPVSEPAITAALTETVAILAGDGSLEDRITVAPFSSFPHPPGSLRASLFQYAGSGHVMVVGPTGFVDDSCLRISVVTSDLRPLDTITHGPCTDPVGRNPSVGCVGPDAVLLDLIIPDGEVGLPEGGTGFADAVRLQLVADGGADYELLTIRGTIEVDIGSEVVIPRFGGNIGETITFDLGADRIGSCTLTGDFPDSR